MISRFLQYIAFEKHYSSLTVEAYRLDLSQFAEFVGSNCDDFDPNAVTKNDIRAWLLQLMDEGMSARSVNRKLSSVKSLWRFALQMGITEHNTPQLIRPPKMDKPLPAFFKDSEMAVALETRPAEDDYDGWQTFLIINLLYQTGIREAELIGLTDERIDMANRELRVLGKRNKERIVPFGMRLRDDIQQYIQLRDQQGIRQCNRLFINKKGEPISPGTVYHIVHQYMEQFSSLHKQSPHVLRHTFATALLENGADINSVKALLGHASLAATQVYTHTTFEEIQKAYKKAHPKA